MTTMRLERSIALPERREDGSWRYPVQVVIQETGKYYGPSSYAGVGFARFELVGYVSDLAHRQKLEDFLK